MNENASRTLADASACPAGAPASPAVGLRGAFLEYYHLLLSDLYRIDGEAGPMLLLKSLLLDRETYRYNFWLRTARFASRFAIMRYTLYPFIWYIHRRISYKLGISIPATTSIGSGFYICHFGGIVVNGKSVIGRNCNISQGVTIGQANRGRRRGVPTIGDGVYIGPGAKIVGAVTIGSNVAVGANCVVTSDVPDNAVVVGIPGQVISSNGAEGYVCHTDYDAKRLRTRRQA